MYRWYSSTPSKPLPFSDLCERMEKDILRPLSTVILEYINILYEESFGHGKIQSCQRGGKKKNFLYFHTFFLVGLHSYCKKLK